MPTDSADKRKPKTWAQMSSRERRDAIKLRKAFPRSYRWRWPPEKDPLRGTQAAS